MDRYKKILSVTAIALIVGLIPILNNSLSADSETYGPYGAFSVFVKNNYKLENSTVEGRIAAGNINTVGNSKIASGYDALTVIGYFLENTEYPSLVAKNQLSLSEDTKVVGGELIAGAITSESDSSSELTIDEEINLNSGFDYFEKEALKIGDNLANLTPDIDDPNLIQNYPAYYTESDKSIIVIDDEAEALEIDQIDINTLQSHEKIVIRSSANSANFTKANVTYQGQEINLNLLDNEDQNVESLANNIVWYFPKAQAVNIEDSSVVGSIYAPNATMTIANSTVAGQIYVSDLVQTEQSYIVNRVSFANEYDFGRRTKNTDITVEYVDEEGSEIAPSTSYSREIGTTFTAVPKEIEGYDVTENSSTETLEEGVVVASEKQTFTLTYAADVNATLTVNYILEDGTQLADSEQFSYLVDDEYYTSPLDIEGYVLTQTPENQNGIISGDTTVDYIYVPVAQMHTITILHKIKDGDYISGEDTIAAEVGTEYDTSSQILANRNYNYVGVSSESDPISGTADSDKTVILEYSPITVCAQAPSAVSGELADTELSLTGSKRVLKTEIEYNEVKSTGLVEQQPTSTLQNSYDFGLGYTQSGVNPTFVDYNYTFNGAKNFDNYIPIRQTGEFEPINVVISSDGTGYDLRSRNDTSSLATYTSNGINYQGIIAASSYKSLNVRFEECQAVVSYNNGSTSSNGAKIMTFSYTDFPALDETFAGVSFDWNATTKQITVNIMFEKEGSVYYSGNNFDIDLSAYSFSPQNFAVAYQNTIDTTTTLYSPYTTTTRYFYKIVGLQSPYVDTTNTRFTLTQAMAKNEIYEVYAVNGVVQDANQLTSSSYIKSYTLPYNPKGYTTMISSYFPRNDSNLYAYLVGKSYTVSSGFTLKSESAMLYGKNKHPNYSATATTSDVTLYEGDYTSLSDVPSINVNSSLFKDGEQITSGDAYNNIAHVIIDESNVKFATKGSYSALGYVKTRDNLTGEYITTNTDITVTITGAISDYGDAPSSYGAAGALVGSSKYRFNIGINRNGNRETHADAESSPRYSADARGDDTTGMSDETGWFNMDTSGVGELNVEMEKVRISFPYTATGNAAVAFWIDYNQNGVFEDFEGQIKNVNASSYDAYGMVNFDVDLTQSFSTLEAGDTTYARVRILSSKQNLSTADSATSYDKYYGETEDFMVSLYGKKNEYQICTQVLANTPIVTVKNVSKVTKAGPNGDESGVKYVFDIGDSNPNSNSSNSFYPDVQVTVTSKQGIVSNTGSGEPAYFRVEQSSSPYERPANTIHIESRNKNGDPINLPFTFSFWDLDDFTGSSVIESVTIDKDSMYMEGLEASDIKLTADTVGMVEDYGTYLKLFTTKQVESEPEAVFLIQGTSLAKSDISIVEEARLLEIGMGLDLGQMDKVISECVEPYEPKAQIQIFDQFYDDEVSIYNNYPFAYQSTNIPFPYFANFNSVTQNLYIPEGVEFVDGNTDVTIYRRNFLGNRTEDDWEVVDSKLYTQTLDLDNNISSVTFKDPVANNIYGYEYRMEYDFEISEDMPTGQRIVFKSDFVYNKGKSGENTETYQLNDVTAIVKEAFTADLNTVMGDDTIYVNSDSQSIYYEYEYLNCDTCQNSEGLKSLSSDIEIPIPDKSQLDFYTTNDFDMYEDILLTLYDNDMKVFEIPIRRWYPTETEVEIEDTLDLTQITEDLNPVAQTVQIRAAYLKHSGFDKPVKIKYTQEVINIEKQSRIYQVENSILSPDNINVAIDTEPTSKVPESWRPTYWGPIEADDLTTIFDSSLIYVPEIEECDDTQVECEIPESHQILIEAAALDPTLETEGYTIDGDEYKAVHFNDEYSLDEDEKVVLGSKLDARYIIESYSGRIYNSDIEAECSNDDEELPDCYGQIMNYYEPSTTASEILNGRNDAFDTDYVITEQVDTGMPLSSSLSSGDSFNYFLHLSTFGLNQADVTIADKLEIKSTPIGYYENDSSYYFKRENPTEEEETCIKNGNCDSQYEVIIEGNIKNPVEIQNEISNTPSLLDSFKAFNTWLDQFLS